MCIVQEISYKPNKNKEKEQVLKLSLNHWISLWIISV